MSSKKFLILDDEDLKYKGRKVYVSFDEVSKYRDYYFVLTKNDLHENKYSIYIEMDYDEIVYIQHKRTKRKVYLSFKEVAESYENLLYREEKFNE